MFDIFARFPDGRPIWMESVEGLENANRRVLELTQIAPRDYFIYSAASGTVGPEIQIDGGERRTCNQPRFVKP
jgi:hypothetical protein